MEDYSPKTFGDTKNTLGSFKPSGLSHPQLDSSQISEFQAERLLEAGYVIVHNEVEATRILMERKS